MAYYNQFMEYLKNKPDDKERFKKTRPKAPETIEPEKEKQPDNSQKQSEQTKHGHYNQFLEYLKQVEKDAPDMNERPGIYGSLARHTIQYEVLPYRIQDPDSLFEMPQPQIAAQDNLPNEDFDIPEDLEVEIKIEPGSPSSPPGFFEEPAPLICSSCKFSTLWLATFIRHVKKHNDEKLYAYDNDEESLVNNFNESQDYCDAVEQKPDICEEFEEKLNPYNDLIEEKFNVCHEIDRCITSDKVEEKLDPGTTAEEECNKTGKECSKAEEECSEAEKNVIYRPDEIDEKIQTCNKTDENLQVEEKADDVTTDQKEGTPTKKSYHNCKLCKYKCRFPGTLLGHMRTKHKKAFDKIHETNPVLDPHHKQFLTCNICSYTAIGLSALGRHISTHQSKDGGFQYTCHICEYNIVGREDLINHFKDHLFQGHTSAEEKCTEQNEALILVEQNHSKQEKVVTKYFCEHCTYWSHKKKALALHVKEHARENSLSWESCELCSYKCTTQWKLKKHRKKMHEPNLSQRARHQIKLRRAKARAARTLEMLRRAENERYPLRNGFSNFATFLTEQVTDIMSQARKSV